MIIKQTLKRILPKTVTDSGRYRKDAARLHWRYRRQASTTDWVRLTGQLARARRTILFYPQLPMDDTALRMICARLGCRITTRPEGHYDAAVKWHDATWTDPSVMDAIPLPPERIINGRSLDISKQRVQKCFAAVFGYELAVDPTTHEGPMVQKADGNAAHDGRVLDGPIDPQAVDRASVYEKLIENRSADGMLIEYRVPVIGGRVPVVYRKARRPEERFERSNRKTELVAAEEMFSADELENIARLSEAMGLDYGEVDAMRDTDDRLYVFDVNHTPAILRYFFTRELSYSQQAQALDLMADVALDLFNRFDIRPR